MLGPSVLDKRVGTSPIATHLGSTCAQTMPRLPKLWSHARDRQSCYRRVMADTYSMTIIKAIHLLLDKNETITKELRKINKTIIKEIRLLSRKANKRSLIKIRRKNDIATRNTL